jgi:hypothetical protein
MKPLEDVLREELTKRGWSEWGLKGHRVAAEWKHRDGEVAISLNDAIIRQLVRDAKGE